MKRVVWIAVVALVVLAGGTAVYFASAIQRYATSPLSDAPVRLSVKRGATLRSVLAELSERGVVEKPQWVYLYARHLELTAIKVGEYQLAAGSTPAELLETLAEGQVLTESFSIPEGYNRWQIRDVLAENDWIDARSFDALCDDTEFLKAHQVPGPSCEGYLFPETYTFARGVSPRAIMGEMLDQWRRNLDEVLEATGTGPLDLDRQELTTLASIVEKETGAAEERPRIACVFYNRLQSQPVMKLQTDPTVIYAATLEDPSFDGNLKSYHLRQMRNPYNTYLNVGLPPGPIASPGRAAFEAVSQPAECNDLFFVSMNNGKHVFCPTYECHLRNVQKWQVEYFRRTKN